MKFFIFSILFFSISYAETEIKPIIITTEKIELTEGMISSDKISEEAIQQNPQKNIAEITKTLPNVERSGSIRSSNSEFKIRGLEDTRITTKIDGSKTTFRGEYKGRNFISPFMLSEIILTRGSNSVTEGSGAIAGSVNLKTKDVDDIAISKNANSGGEIFASYGDNGNMQNYAGSTFVRKDGLSLLGMYNFTKNNDFLFPDGKNIEYTNGKTNNAMFKLKKAFNENEFIQLSSSFFEEKGESTSNPFRLKNSGSPIDKKLTNQRYTGEINLLQANIKLFYDTTYIKESSILAERVDTTNFTSYGMNAFGNLKFKEKNTENLFIYGLDFTLDEQNGTRPERENLQGAFNKPIIGREAENIFPKGKSRNEGLYVQNVLKIENFALLVGARKDYYILQSGNLEQKHSSDILKKAVISYHIAETITPFIRYSEGYRAPLIKETFSSGSILTGQNFNLDLISNPSLKPEYSKNYETGFKILKQDLLEPESETSLNLTYFVQDIKNFIIQDPKCSQTTCSTGIPTTAYVFQYQNLPEVRLRGLEIEAKYSSNSHLFSIAASTLKANERRDGNHILQTPARKLILKAQRKFENGFSFGAETISASSVKKDSFRNYSFDSFLKPNPLAPSILLPVNIDAEKMQLSEETSGYTLVNFNIQYERKALTYENIYGIMLNNAFNVEYKEQTSFIPGIGRNVSIYAKIKF